MEAPRADRKPIISSPGWTRDYLAEEYLDNEIGVAWDYVAAVPIGLIDTDRSYHNEARLNTPLDKERVEEYAESMAAGARFPAPVTYLQPDGSYLMGGGNHRHAGGVRANRERIDIYVLRVTDESIREQITQNLNRLEGSRPPRQERVIQAMRWMKKHDRNIKAASLAFQIPESTLSSAVRAEDREKRFKDLSIRPDAMPKGVAEAIATIPLDNVMTQLVDLQQRAGLTEKDVRPIVSEVKKQTSEAGQLAAVQQIADRDDMKLRVVERRKGLNSRSAIRFERKATLFRALSAAAAIIEKYPSRAGLQMSNDQDYARAAKLAEKIYDGIAGLSS